MQPDAENIRLVSFGRGDLTLQYLVQVMYFELLLALSRDFLCICVFLGPEIKEFLKYEMKSFRTRKYIIL